MKLTRGFAWAATALSTVSLCSAGRFWNELNVTGVVPMRDEPALAYCEVLDVALLASGESGESASKDLFVYSFQNGEMVKLDVQGLARFGANLVAVDPHPDFPHSCRFLMYGGNKVKGYSVLATDGNVMMIQIFNVTGKIDATAEIVTDGNDSGIGRIGAGAVGYGNAMYVLGGVDKSKVPQSDIWRFELQDVPVEGNQTQPLDGSVRPPLSSGEWKRMLALAPDEPSRYFFSSSLMDDHWMVYSGQGMQTNMYGDMEQIARSSFISYKMDEMANSATGDVSSTATYVPITQARSERLYRIFHASAVLDNTLFVYGGKKLLVVLGGRNRLVDNDYVSLTNVDLQSQSISCKTGEGENVGWCGFREEFPGGGNVVATQRKDTMIVYKLDGGARLFELNLTSVLAEGKDSFLDAAEIDRDDADGLNDFLAFKSLQYALIAVCVFLILAVGVLFRQRASNDFVHREYPEKNRGVSLEVIRALDFVQYDPKGNHIPVQVEYNSDGEPEVVKVLDRAPEPNDISMELGKDENGRRASDSGKLRDTTVDLESGEAQSSSNNNNDDNHLPEDGEGDLCSICLLDFEEGELLQKLPCGHLFHADCVEPWLLKNATCPQDRMHIVTKKIESEHDEVEEEEADGDEVGNHNDDEDEDNSQQRDQRHAESPAVVSEQRRDDDRSQGGDDDVDDPESPSERRNSQGARRQSHGGVFAWFSRRQANGETGAEQQADNSTATTSSRESSDASRRISQGERRHSWGVLSWFSRFQGTNGDSGQPRSRESMDRRLSV